MKKQIAPKKNENFFLSLVWIVLIALIFRAFLFQSYNIPSGSMLKNLLVGDYIFVSKYTYGYSKHSLPFSIPLIPNRIFSSNPVRGDVVVFKLPSDGKTDYIKRVIGMPGDKVQIINGEVYINNQRLSYKEIGIYEDNNLINRKRKTLGCRNEKLKILEETLPNGKKHKTTYLKDFSLKNSDLFIVPDDHYFFLGDNRDCSKDSRFLSSVGYVHKNNLVGKARFIFFSLENSRFLEIWKWPKAIRGNRIFSTIK